MDTEQAITDIEWLERTFAVPDTRPLTPSDVAAANRKHDEMLAIARGFAFGRVTEFAADLTLKRLRLEV